MSADKAWHAVESLSHWEKIEGLSRRFATPHIPEYELEYFKNLYHSELRRALDEVSGLIERRREPGALARRGRLRRLFGDLDGAASDLRAALDLAPDFSAARAWLGELDLRRPEAELNLTRALEDADVPSWARLYRGAARFLARDFKPARRDLTAFLERSPGSALGWLLEGLAAEKLGDRRGARRAYENSLERNPVCSAVCLLLSRLSARPSRVRYFRQAYNVGPVLGFLTLQIHRTTEVESDAYVRRITRFAFEHPEKVGAFYRRETTLSHFSHFPADDYDLVARLVEKRSHLAWTHGFYGRAACYTAAGAEEGVRHMSRAIELSPQSGWLYAWRANALRLLGKKREALADFNASIRLQPFYHRAFVWRGSLFRRLGRLPEALSDLDRALLMDPYYSLTYHERSMARRASGDFVGAALDLDRAFFLDHRYSWVFKTGGPGAPEEIVQGVRELGRAIAAHPSVPSLWAWRGELKTRLGDWPEAFSDFERAIQLDSSCALALGLYGRGLLEAGHPDRAEEPLSRAITLEPQFWIAYGWLAQAKNGRGRRKEASRILRDILRRKPKTPWAHRLQAQFDLEAGKTSSARGRLMTALDLDGKYPEGYLLLAQVELARGKLAAAFDAIERCVGIAPNMGRAYVVRAKIHEQAGRVNLAVADYRRVMMEFPYLLNARQRKEMELLFIGSKTP